MIIAKHARVFQSAKKFNNGEPWITWGMIFRYLGEHKKNDIRKLIRLKSVSPPFIIGIRGKEELARHIANLIESGNLLYDHNKWHETKTLLLP